MHRTQLLLEEWQYQTLRARAEREQRSLSDLVRGILCETLAPRPRPQGRLHAIQGIGEDPAAYGRVHDRFLYGDPGEGKDEH
jgi:plasmid stability protein